MLAGTKVVLSQAGIVEGTWPYAVSLGGLLVQRILKAAREKQRVSYKGTPIRLSADFSAEILQDLKGVARYIQSPERGKPRMLHPA